MEMSRELLLKRLLKTHPIIANKLIKLYGRNPGGIFSDDEVNKVGLTDAELKILNDYGIFKRVERS